LTPTSAPAADKAASATSQSYPPFVSLPGGMATLVQAIVDHLPVGVVHTAMGVTAIQRADSQSAGYRLTLESGETVRVDAVILATPAFVTARLVEALDPALATLHAAIPYASSAIVSLAYAPGTLVAPDGYGY